MPPAPDLSVARQQALALRAPVWQLRHRRLALPLRPLVMGILNVTPDSFSDGGHFVSTAAAVEHGLHLVAQGADILDIGGESTRPYSEVVDVKTELQRVLPVIEGLAPHLLIPLSIDTTKAEVAEQAVAAGAEIINDISGLEADPRMIEVARSLQAGVCAMHMQGTPQTMQDHPTYDDVVAEVLAYLQARRDRLVSAGIDAQRIALDPGIGFGKTHQHNLTLLANTWRFHELGCPLLLGPSRKSFIAKVIGDKQADRAAGTAGVCASLAAQQVQIVRVHDVAAVRHALQLFAATGGIDGQTLILDDE
jgi:dihydropteroate synthase